MFSLYMYTYIYATDFLQYNDIPNANQYGITIYT